MHDFQHVTASALPELLVQLKAGGYKVVHQKQKCRGDTAAIRCCDTAGALRTDAGRATNRQHCTYSR